MPYDRRSVGSTRRGQLVRLPLYLAVPCSGPCLTTQIYVGRTTLNRPFPLSAVNRPRPARALRGHGGRALLLHRALAPLGSFAPQPPADPVRRGEGTLLHKKKPQASCRWLLKSGILFGTRLDRSGAVDGLEPLTRARPFLPSVGLSRLQNSVKSYANGITFLERCQAPLEAVGGSRRGCPRPPPPLLN